MFFFLVGSATLPGVRHSVSSAQTKCVIINLLLQCSVMNEWMLSTRGLTALTSLLEYVCWFMTLVLFYVLYVSLCWGDFPNRSWPLKQEYIYIYIYDCPLQTPLSNWSAVSPPASGFGGVCKLRTGLNNVVIWSTWYKFCFLLSSTENQRVNRNPHTQ